MTSTGHTGTAVYAADASATLELPRPHSLLEPTQSWGGEEDKPETAQTTHEASKASKPKGSGGLAKRVVSGVLMGAVGASAVLSTHLFLVAAAFISYHATIEYYTMVRAAGRGKTCKGMIVRNVGNDMGKRCWDRWEMKSCCSRLMLMSGMHGPSTCSGD